MNQCLCGFLLILHAIGMISGTAALAESARNGAGLPSMPPGSEESGQTVVEGASNAPQGSSLKEAPDSGNPSPGSPQLLDRVANTVKGTYTIGAEDVLEITVWRNQDLSKVVQVRPDGKVSLPVIRDVIAVGKTPTQLADEITRRLRSYVQNPVVAISVKEVNSYNVFLLGEVMKPGKYSLKSKTTLLQGITMAGGFTPIAARNQVVVFRFGENGSTMQTLSASYDDIVLRGGILQNIELQAGDTIVVPSEAMVVFPGH